MTTEQVFERDRIAFQRCKGRDLPVIFVLAGGYRDPINSKLLPLHLNTFKATNGVLAGGGAK